MDRRPTTDPTLSPSLSEKRRKLLPITRIDDPNATHTTPHPALTAGENNKIMPHTLTVTYTNAEDSKQLVATPLITRASDNDDKGVSVSEHMRVLKQALGDAQEAVNVFLTAALPPPAGGAAADGAAQREDEDEDEDASGSEDGS
ncbi:hypothetical protein HDU90_005725 [Geranomyces variabilis]|nr:hypothetical protein HDU90_005725 [Geranomyces variabilis]